MKNKIFLSMTMLVGISSYVSASSARRKAKQKTSKTSVESVMSSYTDIPTDDLAQAAVLLLDSPQTQAKLEPAVNNMITKVSQLLDKSLSDPTLRKNLEGIAGNIQEAALKVILNNQDVLMKMGLAIYNDSLTKSDKNINSIMQFGNKAVTELQKSLAPDIKVVTTELKKLLADNKPKSTEV